MTLKLQKLTKTYGGAKALDGVTFSVAPGERVALLGHNGAGKSTLMKIVLGLIPFDGGTVSVLGAAPGASRQGVAYLPENVAFHPALTGEEQIRLFLSVRGEPPRQARDLLARVGLHDAASRRIGTYSKGMRQRVGLAQALIGHPRLLILDEPTSGLDPVSRRDFYALLDGLSAEGASILLSSHALTEVEARTDRIVILSGGRLVAQGSMEGLRHEAGLPVALVVTPATGQGGCLATHLPQAERVGEKLVLSCPANQKLTNLARIAALGPKVADVDVIPPSLEDIYSHFSKRDGQ
ncbi:ABC transporter ATP-binding protein [Rhodobacter sp. KR11]|uniref:ABC transporter ATP-binding protein n=1 Tax=Rhodobacter sp. KR11 TaxID=2974588 RepID=UPI002223D163|nr:ABC transporter ATP-binding protein [Rhodobacter sp. KR11]MCW1917362.1 ABC transporter ATP-binding protein [Rhodobacter sp. KR11]